MLAVVSGLSLSASSCALSPLLLASGVQSHDLQGQLVDSAVALNAIEAGRLATIITPEPMLPRGRGGAELMLLGLFLLSSGCDAGARWLGAAGLIGGVLALVGVSALGVRQWRRQRTAAESMENNISRAPSQIRRLNDHASAYRNKVTAAIERADRKDLADWPKLMKVMGQGHYSDAASTLLTLLKGRMKADQLDYLLPHGLALAAAFSESANGATLPAGTFVLLQDYVPKRGNTTTKRHAADRLWLKLLQYYVSGPHIRGIAEVLADDLNRVRIDGIVIGRKKLSQGFVSWLKSIEPNGNAKVFLKLPLYKKFHLALKTHLDGRYPQ